MVQTCRLENIEHKSMKEPPYSNKYSLWASRAHQSYLQLSFVVRDAFCPRFLHVLVFNPPVTISQSDRPGHFFQSGFWPGLSVTIPWSNRPFFFHFFSKHTFNPKRQWPYHSFTDWVPVNDHITFWQTRLLLREQKFRRAWYSLSRENPLCLLKKPPTK